MSWFYTSFSYMCCTLDSNSVFLIKYSGNIITSGKQYTVRYKIMKPQGGYRSMHMSNILIITHKNVEFKIMLMKKQDLFLYKNPKFAFNFLGCCSTWVLKVRPASNQSLKYLKESVVLIWTVAWIIFK